MSGASRYVYALINGLFDMGHRLWHGHAPDWCECEEMCDVCFGCSEDHP